MNLLASSSSLYKLHENNQLARRFCYSYVSFLEPLSLDNSVLTLLVKSSFDFLLKDMQKNCSSHKESEKYL